MTGAERKRIWRLKNPERSAEYERGRAQKRRDEPFPACSRYGDYAQKNSYYRYEARREAARLESRDPLWAAYLRGEISADEATTDEMRETFRVIFSFYTPHPSLGRISR